MMTFDIIGDLAFGKTFRGIESGQKHPWIARIEGAMMQGAVNDCFKCFPTLARIIMTLIPRTIQKIITDTKTNERYSIDLVTELDDERFVQERKGKGEILTNLYVVGESIRKPTAKISLRVLLNIGMKIK